jgi:molecular chaperone Hsp33
MENVLRALIYDEQVSLTVADTTEIVRKAIALHALSRPSAVILGKFLSAGVLMCAGLKEERGELSVTFQSDGEGRSVSVSGNRALRMRGYVENAACETDEPSALGQNGAFTVVRDDGYNRPFVGTCGLGGETSVDALVETYYAVSEQLPTYVALSVEFDGDDLVFAGAIALQPLPFTDEKTKAELPKGTALSAILQKVRAQGIENVAKTEFSAKSDGITKRNAAYQCNCSREYLAKVLSSLGEKQMREIIEQDGAVRVHCHYCNTDYAFDGKDADEIFKKE